MAECLYYLNMSGEVDPELNENNLIGNEVDLDGYIYDHRDELLMNLDRVDLSFALPKNASQKDVVNYINNVMVRDAEVYLKSKKKYDITAAWDQIDPDNIEIKTSSKPEFTSPEDGAKYNVMGTIVGDWISTAILKGEDALDGLKKDLSIFGPGYESKTQNFYNTLRTLAPQIANMLKSKFKDAEFIFESTLVTKNLTSDFLSLLNIVSGNTTGDEVEALLGRVDITAVMPDGSTATIELKTTGYKLPKNISKESFAQSGVMHSETFQKYCAQVLTYDIIRKQHGFTDTPYLMNIHRKPNGELELDTIMEIPTSGLDGTFANIVRKGIPIQENVKVETLDSVNKTMALLFGSGAISTTVQSIERDISFFLDPKNKIVKYVTEADAQAYKEGYIAYFTNVITGQKEFAKSESELKDLMTIYINDLNKRSKSAMHVISSKFNKLKTIDELRDLLINNGYPHSKVKTAVYKLAKYIGKWRLVDDPQLIANGCLLFQGAGRSEIVMIEEIKSLHEYHKFGNNKKGTTILGKLYGDDQIGSTNRDLLSAQYGNLMIMKAMAIVAEHPEFFINTPISNISALNIRRGEGIDNILNSTIISNWRILSAKFKSADLKQVDRCFMEDSTACVNRARDMVIMCEQSVVSGSNGPREIDYASDFKLFTLSPEKGKFSYEQLVEMWHALSTTFGEYSNEMDWRLKRAYTELNKAILDVAGFRIGTEDDVAFYFEKGFSFSGGYMAPFYRSESFNQRQIADISGRFHYRLHEELQKLITPFQVKLNKVLEKHVDYTKGLSSEYNVTASWFITEKDENGTPQFRVKRPNELSDPDEQDLLNYVLETFAKLRWGDDKAKIERLKSDPESDYYQMPLYEAGWIETLSTSDHKLMSGLSLGKRVLKRLTDNVSDIVNGTDADITGAMDPNVLNQRSISDPFYDKNRKSKLEQYGPDIFTKNIDDIFLFTTISAVKHNLSSKFLPLFTSVRHLLQFENSVNKAGMEDIAKAIDKYIGTIIFDKAGVEPNLISYQKLIQVFRQIFSTMTLGLNPKALVRDTLSSNLRTASVLLKGGQDTLGIDSETFFDCYFEMIKDGNSIFTSSGFNNQLNLLHRMANMSYREIASQMKTNKFSMANLDSQFLFMTTTSSDYLHRMGLLKAYLRSLGAENAYVMNDNGQVVYDMSKDDRWKILYEFKQGDKFSPTDRTRVPQDRLDEYMKRWVEYAESIREWQSVKNISIGDELPLALDPLQQNSIKNLANRLYGAYDKDEQSLVHQTLLGGMFFQFKTYGISRLMDWWKRAGQMNIVTNSTLIDDETGEELFIVGTTKEEFEQTGQTHKIIPKSQVSNEDLLSENAVPYRVQNCAIDEGRIQSLYGVIALGWKAYYQGDQEAEQMLNEKLKSPSFRRNLYSGMFDIFLSLMLQGVIRIVYPEEVRTNMNDQDWWTRWTHAVLTGVSQDGPIWEVFSSVWGGGQIPVVSGMGRWFTSAMGVIHGNDFLPALANSFGATRELSSVINNM